MLLRILDTINLRKGVSDTVAGYLERGISSTLKGLEHSKGLPSNDPLRFNKNGIRLSQEQLHELLYDIIESWPIDKGKWNVPKTNYQGRL